MVRCEHDRGPFEKVFAFKHVEQVAQRFVEASDTFLVGDVKQDPVVDVDVMHVQKEIVGGAVLDRVDCEFIDVLGGAKAGRLTGVEVLAGRRPPDFKPGVEALVISVWPKEQLVRDDTRGPVALVL